MRNSPLFCDDRTGKVKRKLREHLLKCNYLISTFKEAIFGNRKNWHLARIYFFELASGKYFAGINFRK